MNFICLYYGFAVMETTNQDLLKAWLLINVFTQMKTSELIYFH